MKIQKTYLYLLIAVIMIGAGVFAFKAFAKDETDDEAPPDQGSGGASASSSGNSYSGGAGSTDIFARNGDRGDRVRELQKFLNSTGKVSPVLAMDGIWGPLTQSAVTKVFGTGDVTTNQWSDRAKYL